MLGLALVLLVRSGDRVLRLVAWMTLPAFVLLGALDGLGQPPPQVPPTYLADLVLRAGTAVTTVLGAPVLVAALLPPAVVGLLLARNRVLEAPDRHLPLLRRVVLVGLPVSVLGAVPLVLMATQTVQAPVGVRRLAGALHGGTGLVGAGAFLRSGRLVRAPPATDGSGRGRPGTGAVGALAAVGERSLTCYLLQSVLLVPLLSPWALGLAGRSGDGDGVRRGGRGLPRDRRGRGAAGPGRPTRTCRGRPPPARLRQADGPARPAVARRVRSDGQRSHRPAPQRRRS